MAKKHLLFRALFISVTLVVSCLLMGNWAAAEPHLFLAWNYSTLQAAIDACEIYGGGMVLADSCVYEEDIVIDSANVMLRGQGASTIIDGTTEGSAIQILNTNNVEIRDLTVRTTSGGSSYNTGIHIYNSDDVIVSKVTVEDTDYCGIYVDLSDNVRVDEVHIVDTDSFSFYIASSSDVTLNNILVDYAPGGVVTYDGNCTRGMVRGLILSSHNDGQLCYPITIYGSYIMVSDCIIRGKSSDGSVSIWLVSGATKCVVHGTSTSGIVKVDSGTGSKADTWESQ